MSEIKDDKVVEKMESHPKKTKAITVKANRKGRHIMRFMNVLRVVGYPIFYCLKPFKFYGPRKVADGACIYICNHYSLFDPAYVAATTWEGIHFISKREAFQQPIIGWILRKVKAISVNRNGNDARGLLDSLKCLKNNEKVCVFPEGTRNKSDEELLPFNQGAAVMSIKTKTPIVPIVIYKKPKLFRRAHILIGEPFELTEYYDKKPTGEQLAEIDNALRDRLMGMRVAHSEFLANKKKKKA